MTTNFDYLIETAFGVEDPRLRIVISENDFKKYSDPAQAYSSNEIPLYKLHGSKKNLKSGEDTKQWIVATLDALGKQKKEDIFTVPAYQQKLFENIGKGRTLVVLGYSGDDDFDIMPALSMD
ncbi:MAG: SIR2 family protein [Promethearchaeota archaeon]